MQKLIFIFLLAVALSACNSKTNSANTKDTLKYAYKATYSSDITVPGNPVNAQKVLQVWKMFETGNFKAMRSYYADTVTYNAADGMHFHGPVDKLLAYAKQDIDGLDSMRFDIIMWQSAHINNKNEDLVNIWSRERRYPKKGGKADTMLMQENWQVKGGKVVAFDQYTAKK
ncbi:MAG TPA: nuclear transport factor 2 family protein [Mucilaginibacter sp.]|jgi:hypothetical protein|nr:nuclear transport factor 2 family protein [Mucilaginibacter sp.]